MKKKNKLFEKKSSFKNLTILLEKVKMVSKHLSIMLTAQLFQSKYQKT